GPCLYRSRSPMVVVLLCVWTLTGSPPVSATAPAVQIAPGPGSFTFVDAQGDPSKPLTVYTYLPPGLEPSAARIVFVLHGHSRTAEGYRDTWREHADRHGFLVVAPLFDAAQWGGGTYAYASVVTRAGTLQEASRWSFSVIEHLFDALKVRRAMR